MYRIAICDDQCEYIIKVHRILKEIEQEKNVEFAIDGYLSGKGIFQVEYEYDLIFMDIEMKEQNGMDCIDLYRKNHKTLFVILTSHVEEMSRGYLVRAFRFLVKPIQRELLEEAVESALLERAGKKRIEAYDKDQIYILDIDEIQYIEAGEKVIGIRTEKGFFYSRLRMRDIMKDLTSDFYMSHRTYIVNFNFVDSFKRYEIEMKNGEKIKISRLKYDHFSDTFFSFLRGRAYV